MNKRQQTIITFFLMRSLHFGWGLSFLFKNTNNHSLGAFLIGFIISLILIHFITKKDYSQFKNTKLGKFIIILLAIYMINATLLTFCTLTTNFYLVKTPPILIGISLYFLVLYSLKGGLKSIARFSELVWYISVTLLSIILIFVLFNLNFDNFLPLNINPQYNYLKSILITISYSITPIFLLLFILKDYDAKSIKKGYLLGSLSIFINIFGIINILGPILAKSYRYPEFILLKKISVLSFLDRIENFLALKFFIDLLITSIVATYNLSKLFKKKYLYILGIILVISSLKIFLAYYQNTSYLYYHSYIFLIVIGVLSYFLAKDKLKE